MGLYQESSSGGGGGDRQDIIDGEEFETVVISASPPNANYPHVTHRTQSSSGVELAVVELDIAVTTNIVLCRRDPRWLRPVAP